MSRLIELIGAVARHELDRRPVCELAVVTSVFDSDDGDDAQCVSVTLKDSGLAVPRLPVATTHTGVGSLPRVGDVVVVLCPRGDLGSAIVVGQVYSDVRRPPTFTRDQSLLVWPGDVDDPDVDAVQVSITAGDAREYRISLGGDNDASLTVADGALQLVSGGVACRLTHGSSSDGVVSVEAGGTVLELKQDGDLTATATGSITLTAKKVVIEADVSVTVNGQTVEIN